MAINKVGCKTVKVKCEVCNVEIEISIDEELKEFIAAHKHK